MQTDTSNQSFKVKPINSFEKIGKHFTDFYKGLLDPKVGHFAYSYENEEDIELIQGSRSELRMLGFIPAPPNYLLGLVMQYPDITKKYSQIVSIDQEFSDGPIRGWSYLYVDAEDIGLCPTTGDYSKSWIVVIRKEN